jgi:hypothetical protein
MAQETEARKAQRKNGGAFTEFKKENGLVAAYALRLARYSNRTHYLI